MFLEESQVPASFKCPITLEIMSDPVIDPDGNSFERRAIVDWIQAHGTSPITRRPLQLCDLANNRALKDLIDAFHGVGVSVPASSTQKSLAKDEYRDSVKVSGYKYRENDTQDFLYFFEAETNENDTATRTDLIACIDISGSMGELAAIPGGESTSLNILDIVKHACKSVVKSLSNLDRFGIVTFSDGADAVLPLTFMDQDGQDKAFEKLDELVPTNSTNIWAGLDKSMELLHNTNKIGNLSAVLLLTDGVPNINPPRGIIPTLNIRKEKTGLPDMIHTFGFGYNLESSLLCDIAKVGRGSYSFIPDPGFVGTIFVHSVANILTTSAVTCKLEVTNYRPTSSIDKVFPLNTINNNTAFDLGNLQIGHRKSILLRGPIPEDSCFKFSVKLRNGDHLEIDALTLSENITDDIKERILDCQARLLFVSTIDHLLSQTNTTTRQSAASALSATIKCIFRTARLSPHVENLIADLNGQVVEAFRPNYFTKWGKHYLPSLLYAHTHQICNNFKDPGVQLYGGKMFQKIRDFADEMFCKIPAPQPKVPTLIEPFSYSGSAPVPQRPTFDMSMFNNAGAICFHGDGLVKVKNGLFQRISQISRGDVLFSGATVVCVVESQLKTPQHLIQLDEFGCIVTPYHPVYVNGKWTFPIDIVSKKIYPIATKTVYNFVLDSIHKIEIGTLKAVTLGHCLDNDSVTSHPFFGSEKVLNELKNMPGYHESGRVQVFGVVRDPLSGLVESFKSQIGVSPPNSVMNGIRSRFDKYLASTTIN